MNKNFLSAVSSFIGTRKPQTRSQGARTLYNLHRELLVAHKSGLTDEKTLEAFRKMKKENPLRGLKTSTALQYIGQARREFGLRKNAPSYLTR